MQVGIGAVVLSKHIKEGNIETHELHYNGQMLVKQVADTETGIVSHVKGSTFSDKEVDNFITHELYSLNNALKGIRENSEIGELLQSGKKIEAFVKIIDNLDLIANSFVTKVSTNKTMKTVSDDNFIFMVIQNNSPHTEIGTRTSMIRVVDLKTNNLQQAVKNGEQVIAKFKELNMTGYAILPKNFKGFHLTAEQYASIFQ